jgi:hypothetical protein
MLNDDDTQWNSMSFYNAMIAPSIDCQPAHAHLDELENVKFFLELFFLNDFIQLSIF